MLIYWFLPLILCLKKYNIVLDDKNKMYSSENISILTLLSAQDGKVRKTRVGYTMELTPETFDKVKKHPRIVHIEEDKVVKMAGSEFLEKTPISFEIQKNTPWGLSRISGHNNEYEYIKNSDNNVIV